MSKRKNKNIFLILQGSIGNQLFQYAYARKLQKESKNTKKIIVDDSRVQKLNWENSLTFYNLPNVEFVHENIIGNKSIFSRFFWLRLLYKILVKNKDYIKKFQIEKKFNKFANKFRSILLRKWIYE